MLLNSPNVILVDPTYSFEIIQSDVDDNKFVDCAIVANASYIVTNDKHFRDLDEVSFPHVDVISLDVFLQELLKTS